jgi:limonene-1,2-epoxide hydrolase
MMSQFNKNIAMQWFAAFNSKDIEKLLLLYADNAEHFSPKLKIHMPETLGLIKGKASLKAWWQGAFDRLPSLHYEVIRLTADDNQVFMEYIRHVDGEDNLRIGEVLEIQNGLIIASRVYHG